MRSLITPRAFLAAGLLLLAGHTLGQKAEEFQPYPGQPGKDVVWVPTPHALLDKMLDMAGVTANDYVVDLGSGDGRNVIAAAKRGAQALGVEYNPDMVTLSERNAAAEGVSDKAKFIQGDMYEADISQATVLALFLLPDNLRKLTPKFLDLKPGTRIVSNAFQIADWDHEQMERSEGDCGSWCTAYLYIVPAKAEGTWKLGEGVLSLQQSVTAVSGTLTSNGTSLPIRNGSVKADQISFSVGLDDYTGRVKGDIITGNVKGGSHGRWTATRSR
jgi:hypothetical protein